MITLFQVAPTVVESCAWDEICCHFSCLHWIWTVWEATHSEGQCSLTPNATWLYETLSSSCPLPSDALNTSNACSASPLSFHRLLQLYDITRRHVAKNVWTLWFAGLGPRVQSAHTSGDETERKRTSRRGDDTRIGTLKKRERFVAGVMDSMSYRRVDASTLRNPFKQDPLFVGINL